MVDIEWPMTQLAVFHRSWTAARDADEADE